MSHFTNPESCREGQPARSANRLSVLGLGIFTALSWAFPVVLAAMAWR